MAVTRGALVFTLTIVLLLACQHSTRELADPAAPCITSYPSPPAETIRLDGPGAFGPHAGDSLIVRSDKLVRWRGILRSCRGGTVGELKTDFTPWQTSGDTLEIVGLRQEQRERGPKTWLLQLASRRKPTG